MPACFSHSFCFTTPLEVLIFIPSRFEMHLFIVTCTPGSGRIYKYSAMASHHRMYLSSFFCPLQNHDAIPLITMDSRFRLTWLRGLMVQLRLVLATLIIFIRARLVRCPKSINAQSIKDLVHSVTIMSYKQFGIYTVCHCSIWPIAPIKHLVFIKLYIHEISTSPRDITHLSEPTFKVTDETGLITSGDGYGMFEHRCSSNSFLESSTKLMDKWLICLQASR